MVLGDIALQDLGVLETTGTQKTRGTFSNPVSQAPFSRILLPFLGNVCSEHLLNMENPWHSL